MKTSYLFQFETNLFPNEFTKGIYDYPWKASTGSYKSKTLLISVWKDGYFIYMKDDDDGSAQIEN